VITRDDLKLMTPGAIAAALRNGELNHLLNRTPDKVEAEEAAPEPQPEPPRGSADQGARGGGPPGRITSRDQLRGKTAAEIVELDRTGRLDGLKRGEHW
jgi:hypothetical protein